MSSDPQASSDRSSINTAPFASTSDGRRIMIEAAWREIARLEAALASSNKTADRLRGDIMALRAALADPKEALWWIFRSIQRLARPFDRGLEERALVPPPAEWQHPNYERWVAENDTPSVSDRLAMRRHMANFETFPLVSVVMPVFNPRERFFREALDSVCRQLYPLWELCIADDASSAHVGDILRDYAARDPRIKWIRRDRNGHISAATNSALTLATGAFVALMDHDDILPDHALYEVVSEINRYPDVDLIYTDEDHIDDAGRRSNAYFKPDWNAELVLGQNLVSHLGVYRRSLIENIGGLREGYEGSQDHDLALRVADVTDRARIRHIPAILYHWRQNSGEASFSEGSLERCAMAARRAVTDHLRRKGDSGAVVERTTGEAAWQRVRREVPMPTPSISLIVPTKDQPELLGRCLDGLLHRTNYPNFDVLIVYNDDAEAGTHKKLSELSADDRVRILTYSGLFNISAIYNMAVAHAEADVIGLVNDDIDVISPTWLTEMVSFAAKSEVGAVGAKLLYPDGLVAHAGILIGHGGVAAHSGHLRPKDDPGYVGRAELAGEVSAVSAACMLVRKSVYEEVGGFDETNLPATYNDVDFCLKLRAKGYVNIFTPFAELSHLKSTLPVPDLASGTRDALDAARDHMTSKWKATLDADPYYNPNLSLHSDPFSLSFPSRRQPPWHSYR